MSLSQLKNGLIVLCSYAAIAFGAPSGSLKVTDASSVTVNVDGISYQCTPGGGGGTDLLVSGSYKNLSGNDLCPQAVRATVSNGLMSSLVVTYLSPCSGGSSNMTCSGGQCTGDGNTVTVLSRDTYYFLNANGLGGRFQLQ